MRLTHDFFRTPFHPYLGLSVFEVMITVTQFDIAVFSIVVEQLASVCTVCLLVREKTFRAKGQLYDEEVATTSDTKE